MLRPLLLCLLLALTGCASFPTERPGVLPRAVQPEDASPARAELNARVFDATVRHVSAAFYRPDALPAFREQAVQQRDEAIAASNESRLYARLRELLQVLDDAHTYVASPDARARQEQHRRGESSAAYGLQLQRMAEGTIVISVRADSPAAEAGVEPGWQLVDIDGQPFGDAPPTREGQPRTLRFIDNAGQERALRLTPRLLAAMPRYQLLRMDDELVYLRFDAFDRDNRDWLRQRLRELAARPPVGIVLDLRGNGGGQLPITGSIAGLFLDRREPVAVSRRGWFRWTSRVRPAREAWHGPLAVLIGPGTGSAAELLTARLRDSGRARLFGQPSAGAVIVSVGYNLPDGGLLRVGSLDITSGSGEVLDKVGVAPDVRTERDLAAVRAGHDPALDAAKAWLATQSASTP